jgi:hypothetical protein
VNLFEHPDFEQAILQAAEHFRERKLRPAIIEKDYYVTEALRVIADNAGDKIIFKGGTSLAKGWNLIQRFSEDVDIFLDPTAFEPPLGKNGIDRELKCYGMRLLNIPRLPLKRAKAKPSVDSVETIGSRSNNALAGPAKLPTGCSLRRAPRADANPRN